jgi:hypothetical protein
MRNIKDLFESKFNNFAAFSPRLSEKHQRDLMDEASIEIQEHYKLINTKMMPKIITEKKIDLKY